MRYTGRFFDIVAQLQDNLRRKYDAAIARWASVDPIGFEAGDVNLYRYVGNGPLWQVDPEGLVNWWMVVDKSLAVLEYPGAFMAGVGDSVTMGATKVARNAIWGKERAEIKHKAWYRAGEYTEVAVEVGVTGGSALLKKAATRQITKKATQKIVKRVGEEASRKMSKEAMEALIKNESKNAEKLILKRLRRQAGRNVEKAKGDVVHHINTLKGHPGTPAGPVLPKVPGGQPSHFPTMGIEYLANNTRNLKVIKKSSPAHYSYHRRAFYSEKLLINVIQPHFTVTRTILNIQRDNNDIDIKVNLCHCE